jgi:hypothetical protein
LKFILYTLLDASVRIDRFLHEDGRYTSGIQRRIVGGMSEAEAIAEVAEKHKPAGGSWRIADSAEMPGGADSGEYDKTFRGAFRHEGKAVWVDMAAAREIYRERLRKARQSLLSSLDVEYQRADERGDATGKAEIAKRKQTLRDVTADPRIERAASTEELAAVWPEVLGPRS